MSLSLLNLSKLKTVARFERKTLLRSWFFRVFAGLTILFLGLFNAGIFLFKDSAPFIFRALPVSLPFTNLIILNIGQAIVAVFLASEFLKQDRKNDTVEVIYARSISNLSYILGKSWGILSLFIALNLVVLILGIIFSFFNADASIQIWPFFIYILLISVPTLVFIVGLSFFLMTLIKNQAATFIVLLGYIALTVFYLKGKAFQIFDYIGYNVPMVQSGIGGFDDLEGLIYHRSAYFFLGIALILFTAYKLDRLPQHKNRSGLLLTSVLLFLGLGSALIYGYFQNIYSERDIRTEIKTINKQYAFALKPTVDSCSLKIKHKAKEIWVDADLFITNSHKDNLDTLLFSLNPSLKIEEIITDATTHHFIRNFHLIKIPYQKSLKPGARLKLNIKYKGEITETTAHLDKDFDDYYGSFAMELFRFKRRYGWVQPNFVCLTSELMWYPMAGAGYSDKKPAALSYDFCKYSIEIETENENFALTQGTRINDSLPGYRYITDTPVPKLNLIIGEYEQKSIRVDSIDYSIFSIKGHDFFSNYFQNITDTLDTLIREIKNDYENKRDLSYPYKRLSFVEVPIHFGILNHSYSITSDAVQPEMIFFPEKAAYFKDIDFKRYLSRQKEKQRRNKEEKTEKELEVEMFKKVFNNFLDEKQWFWAERTEDNPFSIHPLYFTYKSQISSDDWPLINTALAHYSFPGSTSEWISWRSESGLNRIEKANLELQHKPLNKLLLKEMKDAEADDPAEELSQYNIIKLKSNFLFSVLEHKFEEGYFKAVIDSLMLINRFKTWDIRELIYAITSDSIQYANLTDEFNQWYTGTELPEYRIEKNKIYRINQEEREVFLSESIIRNIGSADGLVEIQAKKIISSSRRRNRWNEESEILFTKSIIIPAKSSIKIVQNYDQSFSELIFNTNISKNLPQKITIKVGDPDERRSTLPDSIYSVEYLTPVNKNEFIVDNEDDGFSLTETSNLGYLKRLVDAYDSSSYKYKHLRPWRAPAKWELVINNQYYGSTIRSAVYSASDNSDRIASFSPQLLEAGNYDVYCWVINDKRVNYNVSILHDAGIEELFLTHRDVSPGWHYLGSYYCSPDSTKLEINNMSKSEYALADAAKWVLIK